MIQLTTPFSLGDVDSTPLTHVRIVSFNIDLDAKMIYFRAMRGSLESSEFVKAAYVVRNGTSLEYRVAGDDYDALCAKLTSATDVSIYDEVARELYQWLIDNGHFQGTIV